jgi:hypothetical protein
MEIQFEYEKDTKNTIRFKEILEDELDTAKVGTIYIQKSFLKELGYEKGSNINIFIEL